MFSKGGSKKTPSQTQPKSEPSHLSSPAPEPKVRAGKDPSRISGDMTVTGDIRGAGDLVIDGKVEGDIQCRSLRLGETGWVDGNISAEEARIGGRFSGRIEADKIAVESTAKLKGELIQVTLSVEAGAEIEGHVHRKGAENKAAADPASNVAKIATAGAAE